MTLFADDEPPIAARSRRRARLGWALIVVSLLALVVAAFLPSPYVIEQPGPVYNTLGKVTVDSKQVPLIDVTDDTKTYPTQGSLDMLTVSVVGSRESPLDWMDTALAWLDPSKAVVPVDDIYPQGETVEQSDKQAVIDMQNSQKEAVAAALTELGYDLPSTVTVAQVFDGEPATGVVQAGDVIVSVDGAKPKDVTAIRDAIAAHGTTAPLDLVVKRDGKSVPLKVTPHEEDGATVIGVGLSVEYDFPVKITIQLQNVGGPSAGQMFALGIIDKLTSGSLAGGADVAGTGTIDADGTIGAIGGIRQKLYGARDAGAEYFLAPSSNCDEVTGHVPSGIRVFAVSKLSDSLTVLKTIAYKGDLSTLPTCPAS